MKQCASCRHHYKDELNACPRCWYTGWLRVPAGGESAASPQHPLPCDRCRYVSEAGTPRCPHCGATLRPGWFTLLVMFGLLACPLATVAIFVFLFRWHNPWWLIELPSTLAGTVIFWELLQGKYRAWLAARQLLIGNLALLLVLVLLTEIIGQARAAADYTGVWLIQLILSGVMWLCFHTERVKDYCAVGKPAELTEREAPIFPEQAVSKHDRLLDK